MSYKTGWVKKKINGVLTKVFAFSHVKTVYKDYENGTTLDDVLVETEDFDQSAVAESEISPAILSKINAVSDTQASNYTELNENKADKTEVYTQAELDNVLGTYAKGSGLELGVTDGILTITYNDGTEG